MIKNRYGNEISRARQLPSLKLSPKIKGGSISAITIQNRKPAYYYGLQ